MSKPSPFALVATFDWCCITLRPLSKARKPTCLISVVLNFCGLTDGEQLKRPFLAACLYTFHSITLFLVRITIPQNHSRQMGKHVVFNLRKWWWFKYRIGGSFFLRQRPHPQGQDISPTTKHGDPRAMPPSQG